MKIGTCVNFGSVEEVRIKFAALRQHGFSSCQLLAWVPAVWTEENAARILQLQAEYGIEISAFWCGWEGPMEWNFTEGPLTLGLVPPEYRELRIRNLCDGADFAKKLGIADVVTHMGFIPENPNDPLWEGFCEAVRHVAGHLQANGQRLLFETGQETPVTMLRCFETVDMDNLGINLDTANLILYGKANPVDALEVFGAYVRSLHAKDGLYPTSGLELGREVPLGTGKVDFYALFRKLRDLGYEGPVTIEREIEGEQQLADILSARDYLQTVISDVYGG